ELACFVTLALVLPNARKGCGSSKLVALSLLRARYINGPEKGDLRGIDVRVGLSLIQFPKYSVNFSFVHSMTSLSDDLEGFVEQRLRFIGASKPDQGSGDHRVEGRDVKESTYPAPNVAASAHLSIAARVVALYDLRHPIEPRHQTIDDKPQGMLLAQH